MLWAPFDLDLITHNPSVFLYQASGLELLQTKHVHF